MGTILSTTEALDVVFDGPPSHECGRFVEVEDARGRSVRAGEWVQRPDGYWVLRLRVATSDIAGRAWLRNRTAALGRALMGLTERRHRAAVVTGVEHVHAAAARADVDRRVRTVVATRPLPLLARRVEDGAQR